MSILTASEEDYVIPALKRLGIYHCFNYILTCTGLGMSKSGSDIYNVAAEKCGFENIYYFSRVFKKYTGTAPGAYSKSRLISGSETEPPLQEYSI